MNQLALNFTYSDIQIRTQTDGEIIWFVLKDVCDALGHTNSRMVFKRLDDDEKGVTQIYTLGGVQEMQVVNEPGLYNVILRSDSEKAKPFRRWVTHEVLPSIRKQGYYSLMTDDQLVNHICDKYRNNPDFIKKITPARIQRRIEDQDFTKQYLIDLDAQAKCEELYKRFGQLTDEEFVAELKNICKDASPKILAEELKYYQKYLTRCITQARR